MMHTVYLLTGSNIGDSRNNLQQAARLISEQIGMVSTASSLYSTEPWGRKDQQGFLNQALQVHTALEPQELMRTILGIEAQLGRKRKEKWEPRIIDIDILLYDDLIMDAQDLHIPHPLMQERRFALEPLNELAPSLQHPVFHKSMAQLLAECPDTGAVEKLQVSFPAAAAHLQPVMSTQPAYSFIAIEGNIGAGKTSLAQRLSADFQAKLVLEEFEDNSFLPRFYEDQRRYAFPLEMSFLAARFNQLKKQILEPDIFQQFTVSDYIFAKCMLFSRVTLDDDEYELYLRLFEIINAQMRQPDLLVYLHNPVEKLQWNIANRGRSYEQNIADEYLQSISDAYIRYLHANQHLRILVIDCSGIDFVGNSDHYHNIKSLICKTYEPGIHHVNWLFE